MIFVDSGTRLQRPYGAREKSAAAILSVVKRFVAGMGVPRAFHTDNGTGYSNSMFVDFCSGLGIRRGFTASYTPQQKGPVKRAISRAFEAGHAARFGVPQPYPYIGLEEVRDCTDATGTSLWLESLLWASEYFNRDTTSVNDEWLSPHESVYGSHPHLPLLPFLQPAYHGVPRQRKTVPRARMCYFLNFGYNHGRDCYRLLDAETGRSLIHATSPGTTRKHGESPRSGLRQQSHRGISTSPCRSLCPLPRYLLQPSPLRQLPHRQRRYRHRLHQCQTPRLRSPRALAPNYNTYEGYDEIPGRTRGEIRALRDASRSYTHRHGLPLDHAAMVSILAKGEATNEFVRQHGISKDSPDLPTAYASGLSTPNNISDVDKSPHADIWRHSMRQKFNGFLQAGTFAPAPA